MDVEYEKRLKRHNELLLWANNKMSQTIRDYLAGVHYPVGLAYMLYDYKPEKSNG